MKKKYYGFLMAFALLIAFNAKVSATQVSAEETISSKLAGASDGILEVDEGTFTDTIVIDEDMTIKGAGKDNTIITGTITVDGDVKLTLENVTIKSGNTNAKTISLTNGANLEVKNSVIYSNNENSIDFAGNSSGIYAEGNSKIDVISTTIYAKYAIYAKGGNNEINIKENSSINGYAAVDVSNGIDGEVVEGNEVTIDSSTLTGYNGCVGGEDNGYGTIVLGAQKGLILTITNSTITNNVTGDHKEDLILFADSYNLSSESEIVIENSKLKNTDDEKGSVIYNLGETDSVSTNGIAVSNSETEGKEYADDGENIYIILSTVEGDIVTLFKKDTINETLESFLDEMSKSLDGDEYVFEGYYADDKYENKFNVEDEITENTKIYMKISEKKAEEVDVPNTFDGITSYILIGIVSFVAILSLGFLFKKKLEN